MSQQQPKEAQDAKIPNSELKEGALESNGQTEGYPVFLTIQESCTRILIGCWQLPIKIKHFQDSLGKNTLKYSWKTEYTPKCND